MSNFSPNSASIFAQINGSIIRVLRRLAIYLRYAVYSGRAWQHSATAAEPTAERLSRLIGEARLNGVWKPLDEFKSSIDEATVKKLFPNEAINSSNYADVFVNKIQEPGVFSKIFEVTQ